MVTAADSSVLVASLLANHEAHRQALRALESALDQGELALPMPALVETYSVLTRLPTPHRLRPRVALDLMVRSFGELRVLAVPADRLWSHLNEWAGAQVAGGLVYDALILACCSGGVAPRLLTFNQRHFEQIAAPDVELVVPR